MTTLRKMREKTGTSLSEFALRIGLEPSHLSLLERGKKPCKRTAEKIAKALETDPRALWPDFNTLRDW